MVVGWEEELLLKKMKVMEVGRLMVVAAGKRAGLLKAVVVVPTKVEVVEAHWKEVEAEEEEVLEAEEPELAELALLAEKNAQRI